VLIAINGFSQKVKISKNVINIDDVAVGTTDKYKDKETKERGTSIRIAKARISF